MLLLCWHPVNAASVDSSASSHVWHLPALCLVIVRAEVHDLRISDPFVTIVQ